MKKFLLALAAVLAFALPAHAQMPSGTKNALVVTTCGTLPAGITYAAKQLGYITVDINGNTCGSGGGGGGAVTIADGADVTLGAKADAACGTATGTCTLIALTKYLNTLAGTAIPVNVSSTPTAVTGSTVSSRTAIDVNLQQQGGAAPPKGGIGVVNGGSNYVHVAASQTGAVLQVSAGATGDYLSHCVIYPSTTGAGSVTVFDNTNSAANNVIEFTTGTLSNLAPIAIPVGAVSVNGAWKVTTGANETVVCYGKFS